MSLSAPWSCSVKLSLTRNWLGRGMSLSHCSCTILLLGLVRPADKRLVQQMSMCTGPPTRSRHIWLNIVQPKESFCAQGVPLGLFLNSRTLRSSGASPLMRRWMLAVPIRGGISLVIFWRCGNLSFVQRDIAALDESGQVCCRPADGLNNDICHAPCVFGLLCATACGKKVLFFRSICSQLFASSVLIRDELLCSSIMAYTRWTACGFSLLNTLTQSSLLHETPPSIAWHIDVHFESMASPLWIGGLVFSVKESCMTFVLAYAALYVLLTVTGCVSLLPAAVAKSSCKKPFSPLIKRFSIEG